MPVPLLCWGENLAQIVHGPLNSVYFSFLRPFNNKSCTNHLVCCGYVEEHWLVFRWSYEERWSRKHALEVLESDLCLVRPLKLAAFLQKLIERETFSPNLPMKLRAASLPVGFCTPLRFFGFSIVIMALIFSGLASMPRAEMRYPNNCPDGTPNMHFSGLSLILYRSRLSKVSRRSSQGYSFC